MFGNLETILKNLDEQLRAVHGTQQYTDQDQVCWEREHELLCERDEVLKLKRDCGTRNQDWMDSKWETKI